MCKRIFETEKAFEEKFIEYINYCKKEKRFPNIAGFCVYCNMNRDTFYAQKNYYSDAFKKINDILEDATINYKDINDSFKIFYMKNKFGYRDKQENVNVQASYEDYIKKVSDADEY